MKKQANRGKQRIRGAATNGKLQHNQPLLNIHPTSGNINQLNTILFSESQQ